MCKGAELAPSYSKHQSILHLMVKSWSVWGCLFLLCDSTAHGSCLPPMWNIILKGQGGPSQGTSATPNRI